tara:strand:+ start:1407 stop:1892 length:486 start_codon:yes stop_codon:yes gene_type:complete
MHNKYNNKSVKFIQGLKPFSSSIPKTLKKYLKKGGYNYSNIVDNWTKMVSKKISDSCYPISIKMGKEMRNGTLILNVVHGKELDIEYEKKEIIDQINSFFGYDCVSKISLKIIQEKLKKEKKDLPTIKNFSQIKDKIEKIDNNQLRSSLNNFLKLYNAKKK